MRILPLIVLLLASSAIAVGRDQTIEDLEKEVDRKVVVFEKRLTSEKAKALKAFDRQIAAVRRAPDLDAATKASLIGILTKQKEHFDKTGEWPENNDMLVAGIEYSSRISSAYTSVGAAFDRLISKCLDDEDYEAAKKYGDRKRDYEKEKLGTDRLLDGTKWRGTLTNGKTSTLFHLNIGKIDGNIAEGRIHIDPHRQGHPIQDIRGTIQGNVIDAKTTNQIQGKNRPRQMRAVLMGKKIIMAIDAVQPDKNPEKWVWLERR